MVYLVRQGQTDWNLFKKFNGCTDTGLNQTGIAQAKLQAENLRRVSFDVCFCSPQKRARQTCEIIFKGQIVFDDRLIEINCGEFEGTAETDDSMKLFWQAIKSGTLYIGMENDGTPIGLTNIDKIMQAVILKMIRETDGEKYEEVRSLNQDLTFFEAEKEFKKRDVNFEQNNKKTLKLMNSDRIYTNLGLLISDQCVHTIKIAVFEDTVKAIFKDRYEFNGSLLKQLNEAYQFIDRYNRTHSEITGLHRIDTRDYPIEAIRESLLNAIVHRDYSFSAGILISIFDDRIEFVSIGGLVKGITYDDIMLGVSVPRNENLANVFYRLTLIEAYGTGIPKILRSYKRYSVKPQIEVSDNAFKITLPNVNANLALVKSKELLSDNEHSVLQMFEKQEYITRKEVEKILAISQAMAVRVLKQLSDKNLIQVNGKGKNTRYSL